jgi:hypothetical protein
MLLYMWVNVFFDSNFALLFQFAFLCRYRFGVQFNDNVYLLKA